MALDLRIKMPEPPTVRIEILNLLKRHRRMNTSEIARELGKPYQAVRQKLFEMKLKKLVDSEHVRRYVPGLAWIMMNEWWITAEGEKWLRSVTS